MSNSLLKLDIQPRDTFASLSLHCSFCCHMQFCTELSHIPIVVVVLIIFTKAVDSDSYIRRGIRLQSTLLISCCRVWFIEPYFFLPPRLVPVVSGYFENHEVMCVSQTKHEDVGGDEASSYGVGKRQAA